MTRLAYVCADPGIPVFGSKGASVHVQSVLGGLRRRGFSIVLHAMRCGGTAPGDLRAVALKLLPAAPRGEPGQRAQALIAANADLARALAATGPFDAVYERYSLFSHAGMAFARAAGIPGILEVNAPLIEEQARHRDLAFPEEAERIARAAFRDATTIVAVSPGVAEYLARFRETHGKVCVVANGIDPARFRSPEPDARRGAAFTIGFLGTLKPWHGLMGLIEGFAVLRRRHVPDARMILVGDGPERKAILSRLGALGLADCVELTGAVAPAEVPGLLARMDVGVAPYPALDGFYFSPLKIYEYMAAGLPVVATRVGHLETVVAEGVTGLLCPPGDAGALGATLARLAADPALRRALGRAGREHALESCTWDAAVGRILDAAGLAVPGRRAVA